MVRAEYAPVRDNKAWQWDDIFLTMVVFVAACQDLAFGAWRIGWPSNYLENINSVVLPSIDDDTTRLTRVGGVGQVERGCANFLLVAYRVMRWVKHRHFNGVNYQLVFLINALGKTSEFVLNEEVLGWDTFGQMQGKPLDRYFLLLRAGLAVVALLMSLWTYRSSWRWMWESTAPGSE
jgi:hypothetical protein